MSYKCNSRFYLPYDRKDVYGMYPHCRGNRAKYGLARANVSANGADNSLPFSNLKPMEFASMCIELRRKQLTTPPRIKHLAEASIASITGEDTNTRSAEHETEGKHAPGVRARVTFGLVKRKVKRASNNQSFPTG
jgi:hypothetical protein